MTSLRLPTRSQDIWININPTRVSAPRCAIHARSTRDANFDKVINSLRSESFHHLTGQALACEQFSIPGGRSESRENAQASTKPREAKEVKVFHNCFAQLDKAKKLKNDPRSIDRFFPSLSLPRLRSRAAHADFSRNARLPQEKSLVADYSGTKLPSFAAHLIWYDNSSPPQLHKTTWIIIISSKKMLQQCLSIVTQHGVTCHVTVSWKNSLDDFSSGVYEAAASGKFTIVKTVAVGVWKKLIYLIPTCRFVTTQHWFI